MEQPESKIKIEHGIDRVFITFNDNKILGDQQIKYLHDAITPTIEKNGDKKVILDFSNVQFMSSSFLGLLVKVHKRICEQHGHLELWNLSTDIHKVFKITHLDKVFDIS